MCHRLRIKLQEELKGQSTVVEQSTIVQWSEFVESIWQQPVNHKLMLEPVTRHCGLEEGSDHSTDQDNFKTDLMSEPEHSRDLERKREYKGERLHVHSTII